MIIDKINKNFICFSIIFFSCYSLIVSINPLLRLIPAVGCILLIFINTFNNNSTKNIIFMMLFVVYIVFSTFYRSYMEIFYGIYMYVFLIFSLTVNKEIIFDIFNKKYFWLLIYFISVVGVIYVDLYGSINIGNSYDSLGMTKAVSKEWYTNGIVRNPGFTDGSVSVAFILLFSYLIIINNYFRLNNVFSFLILIFLFLFNLYVLNLTTTKTAMYFNIIIFLLYFFSTRFVNMASKVILTLFILLSYFFMFNGVVIYSGKNTLLVRMYDTWPEAFEILNSMPAKFFGMGFGSIGTPLIFSKSMVSNPADNFLVYLYVTFGLVSVFFIFYFLFKFSLNNVIYKKIFYLTFICLIGVGFTYNLVEFPFASLMLGMYVNVILYSVNFKV